ncbi:hypothetical protein BGX21_005533, partial [Mortierella sp. AD011]
DDNDQNTESFGSDTASNAEARSLTPTGLSYGESTSKNSQEPVTPEKVAKNLIQEEIRNE